MVKGQKKRKGLTEANSDLHYPKSDFQGKLSHTSPNGKITSFFPPEVPEEDSPARTSPRKHPSTMSILQQANTIIKTSPHRIEMKLEESGQSQEGKKPRRRTKPTQPKEQSNKLTDYFPVRRSVRKTKKLVLEELQKNLEDAVLSKRENGLEVHIFEGKGRGIVATSSFERGDFVVEYAGELISLEEAKAREIMYASDQNTGCYMYYFTYKNRQYCVDATAETQRLGRLVNHCRNGNLVTKTVVVAGRPHLVLVAKDTIKPGDELSYDYGDRSRESLRYHPWLAL